MSRSERASGHCHDARTAADHAESTAYRLVSRTFQPAGIGDGSSGATLLVDRHRAGLGRRGQHESRENSITTSATYE